MRDLLGARDFIIDGYTKCIVWIDGRREIFCSTAEYLNGHMWYDWCVVLVDGGPSATSHYACKILGFVKIASSGEDDESQLDAVVHCSAEPLFLIDLHDTFVKRITFCDRDKSLCIWPADSISHVLCVFNNAGGNSNEYCCSLSERK